MSHLKQCVDYVSFDQPVNRMACCNRINTEKKATFIIHQKMLVLGVGTAGKKKKKSDDFFSLAFQREKE